MVRLGSVEAGGTKFVCAVGNEKYQIKKLIRFPTSTPEKNLREVVNFFKENPVDALGVASFGPIEVDKNSPKFGFITSTPKAGWKNTEVVGFLIDQLHIPVYWTTDVNGSVYGEYVTNNMQNRNVHSLVYYTIGTGVGGAAIVDGHFIGSYGTPEMGHVFVKRHPDDLNFEGICPYHKDCLEGLISGPTFEARLAEKGENVPLTSHVWDIIAYYTAQAAIQATLFLRPDKIVFGGSVTNETLLKKVRVQFKNMLNGYVSVPRIEDYIVSSQIKNNGSATIGNFALAKKIV